MSYRVFCSGCGKRCPKNRPAFRCTACRGSLEAIVDRRDIKKVNRGTLHGREFNHARYMEFYPVRSLVSMQEGGTPLLRSRNIEKELKLGFELYFKCESRNPTGSFKDRGSSVEVAKALEFGFGKTVCASTGNMGASVAAYSGIAGLKCFIFVPRDAPQVKVEQILAHGARVYQVRGDYTAAAALAEEASKRGTCLLGDYLYRREGTKSLGFELAEQLGMDGYTYVFSPVGNGTLLSSTWKAFKEFKTAGLIKELPKMAGIQAKGCAPVVKAFESRGAIEPLKDAKTIATAIECGSPMDGERALSAARVSGGFAGAVTDSEILKAREILARREGIFAEPAGAVSLAGLLRFRERVERGGRAICLITGHGLKSPRTGVMGRVRKISASPKALAKAF